MTPKQKQIMAKHLKGGSGGSDEGDDDDGDDELEEVRNPDPPTISDIDDDDEPTAKADDEELPEVVGADGEALVKPRLSRDEKKRNRFREAQESAAIAAAAARRQEEINERLVNLLETRNRPEKEPEKDPLQVELEQVEKDMDLLSARVDAKAGKMTGAEEQEFMKQAREIRAREARLHGRMAYREEAANAAPAVDEGQLMVKVQLTQLMSEFPDVYEYKRRGPNGQAVYPALQWAKHQWGMRMAKAGLDAADHSSPQAAKLRRDVLRDAAKEFGLAGTREVSAGQKRKYGGVPSGGGGSGGKAPIRMSAADEKMMNSRWKHVKDPKERAKLWAKHVGTKLSANK